MPDRVFRPNVDSDEVYVDPGAVFIRYNGVSYYRDGLLYGRVIDPPEKATVLDETNPELWEFIVAKYKNRPQIVEAIRLSDDNAEAVAKWCGGRVNRGGGLPALTVSFPSFEGMEQAIVGDYVIKHADGTYTRMSAEEFVNQYELR